MPFHSEDPHVDPDPLGRVHLAVGGDQRGFQRLSEDHVGGVVDGEVVAQVEDVAQQVGHLVPFDPEGAEVLDRLVES